QGSKGANYNSGTAQKGRGRLKRPCRPGSGLLRRCLGDQFIQLAGIFRKQAYAFGQFFSGHGVVVQLGTESDFIAGPPFWSVVLGGVGRQGTGKGSTAVLKLLEQGRADGQQVASGQRADFFN